jgi:hypothetical protein
VARHEGRFNAAAVAKLSDEEIALVVGIQDGGRSESRESTLARFLSCSEGFADAGRSLGGSFGDRVSVKKR